MTAHLAFDEARRLEHIWNVADAKLNVASKVGWLVAFLASAFTVRWNNTVIDVIAFALGYFVTVLPYFGPAQTAKDIYFRHTKMGKYSKNIFEKQDW
jgi:hypothetical protein